MNDVSIISFPVNWANLTDSVKLDTENKSEMGVKRLGEAVKNGYEITSFSTAALGTIIVATFVLEKSVTVHSVDSPHEEHVTEIMREALEEIHNFTTTFASGSPEYKADIAYTVSHQALKKVGYLE